MLDNELWPPHSLGTTPTYKVIYGTGGSKSFTINGTPKGSCPYTFTPSRAQVNAEIHELDTQVPGSSGNHEGYTNASGLGSGGSVHDLFDTASVYSPPLGGLPSWFNRYTPSTTHMEIWDGDC